MRRIPGFLRQGGRLLRAAEVSSAAWSEPAARHPESHSASLPGSARKVAEPDSATEADRIQARYLADSRRVRFRDLHLEVIDDPQGRLAPQAERVIGELDLLTRRSWGDTTNYRRVIREVFFPATTLTVVRKNGDLVGFSAVHALRVDADFIVLVAGTVVAPEARGLGLSVYLNHRQLVRYVRRRPSGIFLAARTQSPRVVGSILRRSRAWPRPAGGDPPERLRRLARAVVERVWPRQEFDDRDFVIRGAFPKELVDSQEITEYDDPRVNAFCRARLNFARGDAFLMVSRFGIPHVLLREWYRIVRPGPKRSIYI